MKLLKMNFLIILAMYLCLSVCQQAFAIEGKVLFLNDDVYRSAIETKDGKFYEVGLAQHADTNEGKNIFTELEVDKASKKVLRVKGSFEVFEKEKLKQVALIPKIVEGKILPRKKFSRNRMIIGLKFFRIGDIGKFSEKQSILWGFDNFKAIWKINDQLYTIGIKEKHGILKYIFERHTPK